MYFKLKERYHWPNMLVSIKNHIDKCKKCLQRKGRPKKATLYPVELISPWHNVAVDILGPFTQTTSGNRYILSFVDRYSGWPEAFPIPSTETPIVANIMVNEIIFRYGTPVTLLLDNGSNFVSNLMKNVCKLLGINKIETCVYRPQANGQVGRFNQVIATGLAHLVNQHMNNWDQFLPLVLFSYRTARNNTRKLSPYQINFGRLARLPSTIPM